MSGHGIIAIGAADTAFRRPFRVTPEPVKGLPVDIAGRRAVRLPACRVTRAGQDASLVFIGFDDLIDSAPEKR